MLLIRTASNAKWHRPTSTSYTDERALQTLLIQSPDLLPGSTNQPMVVVDEFVVHPTGRVDDVGVDASGNITIIECKLKANPEIRREVIGQVFAYASSLWGMSYEAFDDAFADRAGVTLLEKIESLNPEGWDPKAFRTAVTTNLVEGKFRLVIAIDAITDELKRIVEYLNQHTTSNLQVLALELGYVAHDGVEILVPRTFGEESVQQKERGTRQRWTEATIFAELENLCSPPGVAATRQLYEWLIAHSVDIYWSDSPLPWVSVYVLVNNQRVAVAGIGAWPKNRGVVAINFEYLRGVVPPDGMKHLAKRLRKIPGVIPLLKDLEAADFRKRPNLPIDAVLTQETAVSTVISALSELLQPPVVQHACWRTTCE